MNDKIFIRKVLSDIKVELTDEFDRNFERKSFFDRRWKPLSGGYNPTRGSMLMRTGTLRRSITSKVVGSSVTFSTSVPYAALQNYGGKIIVTKKMKGYFWHRYTEITGSKKAGKAGRLQRKKNGKLRNNKKNRQLSDEALFCRNMALKKVGSKIVIPARQFLGYHPEVDKMVKNIIDRNIEKYIYPQINGLLTAKTR